MAKTRVEITYVVPKEIEPGVWDEYTNTVIYTADVSRMNSRWSANTDSTNDNINLSSQISFIADAFAYDYFTNIRYITVYDVRWKVTNVEVKHPRLILTMGGVYNG